MDGPSLINFTVTAVPQLIDDICRAANLKSDAIDLFLFHQATRKMLDQLRERLGLSQERMPMALENCGNTVSSTLPILIDDLRRKGKLNRQMRNMLIGFGVGWSWAGCVWQDRWRR
jgi:3-oxoacyl-[acyl-carrier-protein] synthase-3